MKTTIRYTKGKEEGTQVKYLFILTIIATLSSCSSERQFKRWQDKGIKMKWFSTKDSTIKFNKPEKQDSGSSNQQEEIERQIDTVIETIFKDNPCPEPTKVKQAVNKAVKQASFTPVNDTTDRHILNIWKDTAGNIRYKIIDKEVNDSAKVSIGTIHQPEPKKKWHEKWYRVTLINWGIFFSLIFLVAWMIKSLGSKPDRNTF